MPQQIAVSDSTTVTQVNANRHSYSTYSLTHSVILLFYHLQCPKKRPLKLLLSVGQVSLMIFMSEDKGFLKTDESSLYDPHFHNYRDSTLVNILLPV